MNKCVSYMWVFMCTVTAVLGWTALLTASVDRHKGTEAGRAFTCKSGTHVRAGGRGASQISRLGGTTSYSKENRIEARDAAKCDQMPAMQRRGPGDLDELGKKKKGYPAPGAWSTGGRWGNWGNWGKRGNGAPTIMGT